jgi:hypothetical protein
MTKQKKMKDREDNITKDIQKITIIQYFRYFLPLKLRN